MFIKRHFEQNHCIIMIQLTKIFELNTRGCIDQYETYIKLTEQTMEMKDEMHTFCHSEANIIRHSMFT